MHAPGPCIALYHLLSSMPPPIRGLQSGTHKPLKFCVVMGEGPTRLLATTGHHPRFSPALRSWWHSGPFSAAWWALQPLLPHPPWPSDHTTIGVLAASVETSFPDERSRLSSHLRAETDISCTLGEAAGGDRDVLAKAIHSVPGKRGVRKKTNTAVSPTTSCFYGKLI